jgi:glucokinase
MARVTTSRLLGDIGATFARFVLERDDGHLHHAQRLSCAEHSDFAAAMRAYLDTVPPDCQVAHAAVAIPYPVSGDRVQMTNYHWHFSIEAVREQLGLQTLLVVNDFTALAMAIPRLDSSERRQVGGGIPRERDVVGVLGCGTGLGMSGLIAGDHGWTSLGSEGGHASFSPADEREIAILQVVRRQFDHVSFERLLSGSGLELIHHALAAVSGKDTPSLPALEITRLALAGEDALCAQTVQAFCCMLGTAASNLAVTLGARGGIYVGGAIVPRLGHLFDASGFRARFESKGRFRDYVAGIPTYVITVEDATFRGISAILQAQLRRRGSGSGLLDRIERARLSLPRAERRVAGHVLQHPRLVLGAPIAEIARLSQVSQPTVIRFCRSLGCEGLSDFKLQLASSLGATVAVGHSQITDDDSPLELGAKVLDNTAAAILHLRDRLNRDTIERATGLLLGRQRIDIFAIGPYATVAQDAQTKFLRLGLASSACTDVRLMPLAAAVLTPNDTLVVISSNGSLPELVEAARQARVRGTAVITITARASPLARLANVAVDVDHVEDPRHELVMISRVLYLLVIDVLVVSIAVHRGGATADALERAGERATDLQSPMAEATVRAPSQPAALRDLTAHGR